MARYRPCLPNTAVFSIATQRKTLRRYVRHPRTQLSPAAGNALRQPFLRLLAKDRLLLYFYEWTGGLLTSPPLPWTTDVPEEKLGRTAALEETDREMLQTLEACSNQRRALVTALVDSRRKGNFLLVLCKLSSMARTNRRLQKTTLRNVTARPDLKRSFCEGVCGKFFVTGIETRLPRTTIWRSYDALPDENNRWTSFSALYGRTQLAQASHPFKQLPKSLA